MATLLCMLTSHMFWNPVASLSLQPLLLSLSLLCWSPICPPSFHLSAPFLPLSPTCREDCVWCPEAEEGSTGAGPRWEDPTSARTCRAAARIQTAPGEPWVNMHSHALAHTDTVTQIFFLLCCPFDLTSFHLSYPQALPLFLCPLMSSKMTSPPAPLPRPMSKMVFTNPRPFLLCQGSQVTSYSVTSQLWARPWTTAPVMLRWGNYVNIYLVTDSWCKTLCWLHRESLDGFRFLITEVCWSHYSKDLLTDELMNIQVCQFW